MPQVQLGQYGKRLYLPGQAAKNVRRQVQLPQVGHAAEHRREGLEVVAAEV